MRLTFTKAKYLGHQNLKDALEDITKIGNNKAITNTDMDGENDTSAGITWAAFEYNINGTLYAKSAGTGEMDITNQSITLTATTYAAVAVLIDSAGAITMVKGVEASTKSAAILLLKDLTIPSTTAVMGFLVLGDGTNSLVAGSDFITIGSMCDFYSVGADTIVAGKITNAGDLIAGLA